MLRGLAVLVAALAVAFGQQPTTLQRSLERRAYEELNRERVRLGLPSLAWNPRLAEQARAHSERMRTLGYFSHQDPERGGVAARLSRAAMRWRSCAENIYRGSGYADPAFAAVAGWMASPEHRRNMLNPLYKQTGVGVAAGPGGTYYFTQIFILP